MVYFNDYFPDGQSAKPYTCAKEHMADCLQYVVMLSDAFTSDQPDTPIGEFLKAEAYLCLRENVSKKEGIFLPLLFLSDRLTMTPLHRFLVLLAFAPETDFQYGYLYAGIQGNAALTRPSLGLAKALFSLRGPVDDTELYQAADEASLFSRVCFVSDPDSAPSPLIYKSLILNRKTIFFLLEIPYCSPRLSGICRVLDAEIEDCLTSCSDGNARRGAEKGMCPAPQGSCHSVQYEQLARLFMAPSSGSPLIVLLSGSPGCGRKHLLSLLADRYGLNLLSIDTRFYISMEEQESLFFCDDLTTELAISNSLLHLDRAPYPDPGIINRLSRLLSKVVSREPTGCRFIFISIEAEEGTKWLSGLSDISGLSGFQTICLEIPLPGADARRKLWESFGSFYPLDASVDLDDFALRYLLPPGRIHDALGQADLSRQAEGKKTILREHLIRSISAARNLSFGMLASKVRLLYTWEDLELPAPQKAVLKLACDRRIYGPLVQETWGFEKKLAYGKGMSLLFYGPPGTGKTMAAQVIARELGMDLYRVDLSQISSKYIGETEKNLNAIFQEAKKADIILFFDEADSLFSKRTDVSNSNDRHANSQTSYILQKIEEYEGISILATNLSQNFDPAFLRRITFAVRFELPDASARLRLWQKSLPAEAPLSGLADFHFLADHFELSGSSIKSILVNAAYLAAGDTSAIMPGHIVQAMKYEFSKNGRMISDEEFGPYQIYL